MNAPLPETDAPLPGPTQKATSAKFPQRSPGSQVRLILAFFTTRQAHDPG